MSKSATIANSQSVLYLSCTRAKLKTAVRTYSKLKFKWQVRHVSSQLSNQWEPTVAIAVRRTPFEEMCLYLSRTKTKIKSAVWTNSKFEWQVPNNFGQLQDQREPIVAIAVRRTQLEEMCLYLSYARTKLKPAVRTDKKSSDRSTINWLITWSARLRTNCGDCSPEDAALQNALVYVLHQNKAQNCCPEHSCTESSCARNWWDNTFSPASDDAEWITATGIMVYISKQRAKVAME
jgi:hypothetical protein